MQRAVDQNARTDAGADEDEGARVVTARRSLPVLAEQRQVHVVLDQHRGLELLLQDLQHRHLRPAIEIGGHVDGAGIEVHGARGTRDGHDEAIGRNAGFLHQRAKRVGDPGRASSAGSRPTAW